MYRGTVNHSLRGTMKSHFNFFLPKNVMISSIWVVFLIPTLCALVLSSPLGAERRSTDTSLTTGSEPPSGFRVEFLQELAFSEHRFILIAEAMPADRYSWRPQGMRSLRALCPRRDCKLGRHRGTGPRARCAIGSILRVPTGNHTGHRRG